MTIDLNFCGGFSCHMDRELSDDALNELIQKIENETNAALDRIAFHYGFNFSGVDLKSE